MTKNHETSSAKRRDDYEPPQAVHLYGPDFAYGLCDKGNSFVHYRDNQYWGACVTGKSAQSGCHAGIQPTG